jgi:hypothetical protein
MGTIKLEVSVNPHDVLIDLIAEMGEPETLDELLAATNGVPSFTVEGECTDWEAAEALPEKVVREAYASLSDDLEVNPRDLGEAVSYLANGNRSMAIALFSRAIGDNTLSAQIETIIREARA